MAAAESLRKLASLAVIGLVIGASAWLWPAPAPAVLPRRALMVFDLPPAPAEVPPGALQPPLLQSRLVQHRLRVDSEPAEGAARVVGTTELRELRATSHALVALEAQPPAITRQAIDATPDGPVGRAFAAAARQATGAFRTADRAIRASLKGAYARTADLTPRTIR